MRIESLNTQNLQAPVNRQNAESTDEASQEKEVSKITETQSKEGTETSEESENTLNNNVTAVSRDGDTLEISTDKGSSGKIMTKITDAMLT